MNGTDGKWQMVKSTRIRVILCHLPFTIYHPQRQFTASILSTFRMFVFA